MTQSTAAPLPLLNFRTTGLPDSEAFAHWREVMGPLFTIEQARYTSALPRGNLSVFVVGEIMANRCTFNAQHLTRDPALIAATPNHLVLQYYRSGGFRGTIAGRPVCIVRGQVAVCDLGREVDAYAASSDTIGLSVPRSLLGEIDPAALSEQLDAPRNRRLGGYMAGLPARLRRMDAGDIATVTDEITQLLSMIFAEGDLGDADEATTPDETGLASALAFIDAHLGASDLSPVLLADEVGLSRGTLYRLFAPMGGIMRYIQERRLVAVRDVLNDPLDRRSLTELSVEHGFTSQAVLSRAFRARFGAAPRDWRQQQADDDFAGRQPSPGAAHGLWQDLGREARTDGGKNGPRSDETKDSNEARTPDDKKAPAVIVRRRHG